MIKIGWTEAKILISHALPFRKVVYGDGYMVVIQDGQAEYSCFIYDTDKTEYDSTYASKEKNVDQYNSTSNAKIVAPTIEDVLGLYPKKEMRKYTITAGQINFFDDEVVGMKKLCGGEYWIKAEDVSKVHDDDIIEFSVIDKDDVLGLFSYYDLTIGVDILELIKFVINDYVKKGSSAECYHSQLYEGIKGTNAVVDGLYCRIMYDSHGTENLTMLSRIYYYE